MTEPVLVDTGPLIALLVKNEAHHEWAKARFAELRPPLLTCEPVLTEAMYLVSSLPRGARSLALLFERGAVKLDFDVASQWQSVMKLMERYADVPMSFADACLLRMSELHDGARIFTLDSDFSVYRRHGRQVVPLIAPPRR